MWRTCSRMGRGSFRMKRFAVILVLVCGLFFNTHNTIAAKSNPPPTIVLISGEPEYQSATTLPAFRKFLEERYGFNCFYLERNNTNQIPGLELLDKADLVILFVRRTTLPDEQ